MDRYHAEGRFEAKDPAETRRNTNRTSAVRAKMKYSQPQCSRDACAATASAGGQVRVPFEGAPANLVILDQSDVVEALRFHAPPAWVISNGRIVDQTRMKAIASSERAAG
jgi:hypothetical protein